MTNSADANKPNRMDLDRLLKKQAVFFLPVFQKAG